jgi:hypothetical protein
VCRVHAVGGPGGCTEPRGPSARGESTVARARREWDARGLGGGGGERSRRGRRQPASGTGGQP